VHVEDLDAHIAGRERARGSQWGSFCLLIRTWWPRSVRAARLPISERCTQTLDLRLVEYHLGWNAGLDEGMESFALRDQVVPPFPP
jgi:hypothetical protein